MLGEDHNPECHLIPLVIRAALNGKPRLKVFGDDYETKDGSCVRDYVAEIAGEKPLTSVQFFTGDRKGRP